MRGYKKHQFLTAIVVFAVAMVGVCIFYLKDNSLTKEQIFALVENNELLLTEIAQSDAPQAAKRPAGVQKIAVVDGTVDFYCGSSGRGSETVYYGFYYRADGMPDAVFCSARFGLAADLQAEGEGFVIRTEDRHYDTQPIGGGFYYYEAHF